MHATFRFPSTRATWPCLTPRAARCTRALAASVLALSLLAAAMPWFAAPVRADDGPDDAQAEVGPPTPDEAKSASGPRAAMSLRPVTDDPAVPETQSYYVYTLAAGVDHDDEIRIANVGDLAGTVLLYPVDAVTAATSGIAYPLRDQPRTVVGSWIELGTDTVSLDPGEDVKVPFTVHVPPNAAPGQYVGGS